MRKSSASNGEREKNIRSDISCGSYVTVYENVALTNYLVHLPSKNDVIMEIYVEEELNERGNGGDLDDDSEDKIDFDDTTSEVKLERSRVFLGDDKIYQADEGETNSVLLHIGDTMEPDEVNLPKPPDDCVEPDTNKAKRGNTFQKSGQPRRMYYILLPIYI